MAPMLPPTASSTCSLLCCSSLFPLCFLPSFLCHLCSSFSCSLLFLPCLFCILSSLCFSLFVFADVGLDLLENRHCFFHHLLLLHEVLLGKCIQTLLACHETSMGLDSLFLLHLLFLLC